MSEENGLIPSEFDEEMTTGLLGVGDPTEDPKIKTLRARASQMAWMAATGLKPAQIAEQTGASPATVSKTLNSLPVRREIQKIQAKLYGEIPKQRFMAIANKGLDVLEEILDSCDKDDVRSRVAMYAVNRAHGMPTAPETLEVSVTIKDLYDRMDKQGIKPKISDQDVEIADWVSSVVEERDDNIKPEESLNP